VNDDSLLGKAQSLLDALREKGLHLPNPTRVDGDTDAVASLAAEIRVLAAGPVVRLSARHLADGSLEVRCEGSDASAVVTLEVRTMTPWRDMPRIERFSVNAREPMVVRVDRDGPMNVALLDVAGVPVASCAVQS
jgi:hypothetical protein